MKLLKFCTAIFCFVHVVSANADETISFVIEREDDSYLEGYFVPPTSSDKPIVFGIQGSSPQSGEQWHAGLAEITNKMGLGLIVLEQRGVSEDEIDAFQYEQHNTLVNRMQDYVLCMSRMNTLAAGWDGKVIFWAELDGAVVAAELASMFKQYTAAVLLFTPKGGTHPKDTEEALESLAHSSIPVFLAHRVNDQEVSVLGSDLATGILQERDYFNYLRLEDHGHELNDEATHFNACTWLKSVVCMRENLILSPTAKINIANSRLLNELNCGTSLGVEGKIQGYDNDDGRGIKATGGVGDRNEDKGSQWSVTSEFDVRKDSEGNTTHDVKVEASWSKEF